MTQQLPLFAPPSKSSPQRRNLVIEAGAGTGKTTAIVAEVLKLMIERHQSPGQAGSLSPERIVLMTFTEKAAGEIAERIRLALEDLVARLAAPDLTLPLIWPKDSPEPSLVIEDPVPAREAFEHHLDQIDAIRSQTIHSFCQSVLRAFPIEAGLDPQFRIVEGFERALLLDEVYDQWLDHETRVAPSPENVRDWEALFEHAGYFFVIRELILSMAGRRDLLAEMDSPAAETLFGTIEDVRQRLQEAILWVLRERPDVKDEAASTVAEYIHGTPCGAETLDQWIEWLRPIAEPMRSINLTGCGPLKEPMRVLRSGDRGESVYDDLVSHRAAMALIALTRRFVAHLDQEKRRRGVADFDDLLLRTLAVLEDPVVLDRARAQYDFIFVDEFQDTDRIQARIIEKLGREGDAWTPGRTIVVGDPKQSIYGFRRADPQLYDAVTSDLIHHGGAESRRITRQYRSDPRLLDSINALCSALFAQNAPNTNVFTPSYTALSAGRDPFDDAPPAPVTLLHAEHEEKDDRHIAEAEAIAAWIRAHGANDLSNIAILFRRATFLDDYLGVLDRYGIEYVLPPSPNFLERKAAVDLITVVRAIAYPFDRGAVISAARSPYFALTDPEIAAQGEPMKEVERVLGSYRDAARHLTVAQLLDLVIETSGIEQVYSCSADGERDSAHLERLRAIAFEYDHRTGGSVRQFVDEIAARREEPEEMEPVLTGESRNAVRVMTVHAAKGLEFDTVILPDLSFSLGSTESQQFFATDDPPSLVLSGRSESLSANFRESGGEKLKKVAGQREEAEMRRLFYVAVTRAKRQLVFVCNLHRETKSAGFLKCLIEGLQADRKSWGSLWPEQGGEVRETLIGPVMFERLTSRSATSSERHRLADHLLERELREEPLAPAVIPAPPPVAERLTPAEAAARRAGSRSRTAGILLHRVLELWNGTSAVEPLLHAIALEIGAGDAAVERVRKRLEVVARSPLFQRINSAETIGREFPLRFVEEGELVERRIDRLIREDGHDVVIDYKSGASEESRLVRDKEQVSRYCSAVTSITARPCHGLLWYVDLERDEMVEVSHIVDS
jgi:ATP-dependent helicase/nuclease subunit A